jgi:putative peptidoglycan lipid II flippase
MIFIQMIFMARDNLASRLAVGSVTALSYGWWIQQVPETLIGTAIATALLPTLSELIAAEERKQFKDTIERVVRVMIALSLPITVILSLVSLPLIQVAFGFPLEDAQMIQWAMQAYLVGLLGHSVVEVGVRAFYARHNAKVPMLVSGLGLLVYIGLAIGLMRPLQASGIALANSVSYSIQALILILVLNRQVPEPFKFGNTALRAVASALVGGLAAWLVFSVLPIPLPAVILAVLAGIVGVVVAVVPIWREVRLLAKL